jgi:cytoskeletal protein CcmA (bactofilin family)
MWRKTTGAKPSSQASGTSTAMPSGAETTAASDAAANPTTSAATIGAAPGATSGATNKSAQAQPVTETVEATSAATPEVAAAVAPVSAHPLPTTSKPSATLPKADPTIGTQRTGGEASRISSGLKIRGEISGNTDLYIDGDVQGKLRFGQAMVTVGPSGRVQADIEAREIVVEGNVQGTLRAEERVRLGRQSRVKGNLLTPRIAIEDGARLSGKVDMTRPGETSASPGATEAATGPAKSEKATKADAMRAAV